MLNHLADLLSDDILTASSEEYGVVLSYALYRGFTDLGARMTDTWLLFLNADFILADGSYRTLARLMKEGKRVIHSPSFRAIREDVMPVLESQVDPETSILAIRPREMVSLALRHKHITVKARTINQRLCHQWRMDQYYWFVDDETLIGYQWPVALVAIKPERVVTEPTLMWDYAFIPDASPNLPRHFISDSDDFFMLETQQRISGEEMIRFGGITPDNIAADLQKWTTKEQRECGRQLLVFHSGELPARLDEVAAESRNYMAEIVRRLDPPQPHIDHPLFSSWWNDARKLIGLGAEMASRPPTGSTKYEYHALGSTVSQMSPLMEEVSRDQGAAMLGVGFLPKDYFSTLNVTANVNIFSMEDNEVVFALFRENYPHPLAVSTKQVRANTRVYVDLDAIIEVENRNLVGLEIRIGPVRPGTLYINGPEGTVPPDRVPYLAIDDLGNVSDRLLREIERDVAPGALLLPTQSVRVDAPDLRRFTATLPRNANAARREDGSSLFRYKFVPQSTQSVLRFHVLANAYSRTANEVVLGVFRSERRTPIQYVCRSVPAGGSVLFELDFDIIARDEKPIEFDVRFGPVRPGEILLNGPEGRVLTEREISHMFIADLGDLGISGAPALTPAPRRAVSRRTLSSHSVNTFFCKATEKLVDSTMGSLFRFIVGRRPNVRRLHPFWLDNYTTIDHLNAARRGRGRIMWVGWAPSFFQSWLHDRIHPSMFDIEGFLASRVAGGQCDVCLCDLDMEEAVDFRILYEKIRPYVKSDGTILLRIVNTAKKQYKISDVPLFISMFPDIDESSIFFFGDERISNFREALLQISERYGNRPIFAKSMIALRVLGILPFVWFVNREAMQRNPEIYTPDWNSALLKFKVRRRDTLPVTATTPAHIVPALSAVAKPALLSAQT